METFHYEHKVEVLRGGEPVTFVHRRSYDAPEDHALHINNSVEVYVYIEGEADYIVEGAYYTLQPGDVMVMTPHQVHRTVLRQPCVYERFYLLLPVGAFSAFSADPVARLLARPADASATVRLRGADWDTAKGLLYRMDEACRRGEGLQSCALLLQLMSLLQAGAPAEKGTALQELPPLLRDILLYIDGNLASIRSVSAIAGHFHVTLPYVSALFSRHIGVNTSGCARWAWPSSFWTAAPPSPLPATKAGLETAPISSAALNSTPA